MNFFERERELDVEGRDASETEGKRRLLEEFGRCPRLSGLDVLPVRVCVVSGRQVSALKSVRMLCAISFSHSWSFIVPCTRCILLLRPFFFGSIYASVASFGFFRRPRRRLRRRELPSFRCLALGSKIRAGDLTARTGFKATRPLLSSGGSNLFGEGGELLLLLAGRDAGEEEEALFVLFLGFFPLLFRRVRKLLRELLTMTLLSSRSFLVPSSSRLYSSLSTYPPSASASLPATSIPETGSPSMTIKGRGNEKIGEKQTRNQNQNYNLEPCVHARLFPKRQAPAPERRG